MCELDYVTCVLTCTFTNLLNYSRCFNIGKDKRLCSDIKENCCHSFDSNFAHRMPVFFVTYVVLFQFLKNNFPVTYFLAYLILTLAENQSKEAFSQSQLSYTILEIQPFTLEIANLWNYDPYICPSFRGAS